MVVRQDRPYDDLETPLEFMPGAEQALHALKRAGHTLLLFSARANRALRRNPLLDPLVRSGVRPLPSVEKWRLRQPVHQARYRQMLRFVAENLPGVFDAIDDGRAGKPTGIDVFLDDRALKFGGGWSGWDWNTLMVAYGEPEPREASA